MGVNFVDTFVVSLVNLLDSQTMNRLLIFQSMMGLTVVCGLLMTYWLMQHTRQNPALKPLAGFNALMAIWCLGHWLLSVDIPSAGLVFLSVNPMMPTLFLHFSLLYVTNKLPDMPLLEQMNKFMSGIYGISLMMVFVSIGFSGNEVRPWLDFPHFLHLGQVGWINLGYTVFVGMVAHGVLLLGFIKAKGNTKRAIFMMFAVGGWGFTLASSYILASMGFDHYPYLLWFIPSYLLLLTFAVLRYQMLAINHWAVKTIIWSVAILLLLGLTTLVTSIASPLGLPHLAEVPLSVLWLYSIATALMLWFLYKPLHRLASRLVYPDIALGEDVIDQWLLKFNACHSFNELTDVAQAEISGLIKQNVQVAINQEVKTDGLLIRCYQQGESWHFEMVNWEDVTPGIRHAADIFASLLYTGCTNLDKSLLLAQQEQQRQEELRLVELGALSASMAHELRNPLNIISMASAQCDDKVKKHIQSQLKRADTLISDLLSYSRVIELNCQNINLKPLLDSLVNNISDNYGVTVDIQCDENFSLYADPFKLQQVLINLLENAASFTRDILDGKVLITCTKDGSEAVVTIHNNGPSIPKSFQAELFKPFISKRPGGSGLGLAIVQRIMNAHQGHISFSEQLGWPVSFVCRFPAKANHKDQTQ